MEATFGNWEGNLWQFTPHSHISVSSSIGFPAAAAYAAYAGRGYSGYPGFGLPGGIAGYPAGNYYTYAWYN